MMCWVKVTCDYVLLIFSFFLFLIPSLVCAKGGAWEGPLQGPARQENKQIIYLADTYNNGGVSAVFRGLQQATQCLGWKLKYFDSNGDYATLANQFRQAIMSYPDAIVLGGVNVSTVEPLVMTAKSSGIQVAGWHAEESVGGTTTLLTNITTDPYLVATMAAQFVIESSSGYIGIVIINDARFDIANAKVSKMKDVFRDCLRCDVLSVENIPINESGTRIPQLVPLLEQQFGRRWTHTLAINDIYFDHINYPLRIINRLDIRNISAGDGSAKAISRIKSKRSQQVATIAEPLNQQGWQLADELNRTFAHEPISEYISKPKLITSDSVLQKDTADGEAESIVLYKQYYREIWGCVR